METIDINKLLENPIFILEFLAALNDERVKKDAYEALPDFPNSH